MTHASLFSGIGGFDLAADWIGWQNVFHCEIDPFCQKILKYYWPDAKTYKDIKKTNFKIYEKKIDVLTGGFPCQPYSLAGKRLGKNDSRHLWPEMLRAIREIKPTWIVGENVFGIVNWDAGLVFQEVQTDLEAEGYEVQAIILPAASVGAPHKRERCFFIGYRNRNDTNTNSSGNAKQQKNDKSKQSEHINQLFKRKNNEKCDTNTNCNGLQCINCSNEINTNKRGINALNDIEQINSIRNITNTIGIRRDKNDRKRQRKSKINDKIDKTNSWKEFPIKSPVCTGNDGISNKLDGITFSKFRKETVKAAGNAVVPQLILPIFKTIEIYAHTKKNL